MRNVFNRLIRTKLLILCALLGGCSPAYAADPPANSVNLKLDFSKSKGLFDYVGTDNIPNDTFQNLKNIDFRRFGNLSSRLGHLHIGSFNTPNGTYHGKNFLSVFVSTTGFKYFISVINRRPEYTRADSPGFPGNPFDPLAGVPNFNAPFDGINWNGTFYFTGVTDSTGNKVIETAAGTTLQMFEVAAIPNGAFMQAHLDVLLVAGSTISPLRLFYSEADAPEIFPAANTLDLTGIKEADEITGLGPTLLGNLPIYTKNTTRNLSGTVFPSTGTGGNINIRVVSDNIGAVHHRTIKNRNNRQLFYSKGPGQTQPGIYSFNGISIEERTKAIQNFFKNNVGNYDIDSSSSCPNAYVYNDKYCLNVSSKNGLHNYYTICIDENDVPEIYEASMENGGVNALDMVTVYEGNIYGIAGTDSPNPGTGNRVYKLFNTTVDDGNPIRWASKTKDYDMGDKSRTKTANRAYIVHQTTNTTFTLRANYDFGRSSSVWTINSTSSYKTSNIETLTISSSSYLTKLTFPQTKFNWINFESSGTGFTAIDSIDFYAQPEPLR